MQTSAALLHQWQPDDFPAVDVGEQLLSLRRFHHVHGSSSAGRRFRAHSCCVDGQNIQDYLQGHYIGAYAYSWRGGISHLPNVLGFGTMNEPHPGLIGVPDLRRHDHASLQARHRCRRQPKPSSSPMDFAQDCLDFGASLGRPLAGAIDGR